MPDPKAWTHELCPVPCLRCISRTSTSTCCGCSTPCTAPATSAGRRELLDLTQPAASQGLTRLRTVLHDPLFMRARRRRAADAQGAAAGRPGARSALATLEQALGESAGFDPLRSRRTFRIHMSDIGEGRFLPELMVALREQAPGVRLETLPLPRDEITDALDAGRIDFAFGFLPMVRDTQKLELLRDRYIVLLRDGPPVHAQAPRRRAAAGRRCASWSS